MNSIRDRLRSDRRFRTLVTAALGGGWNLVYALYHLVLAACMQSWWFVTMGVYYLTVCGMRASALRLKPGREGRALKRNGVLTLCLAAIFSGVVYLSIAERHNNVYSMVVALSMAVYTFACAVNAIARLARVKRERSVKLLLLRNTSMVYALGSMFGLERMMLGTFGNAQEPFTVTMEAASGAGFFVVIVLLGLNLLRLAARNKRRSIL